MTLKQSSLATELFLFLSTDDTELRHVLASRYALAAVRMVTQA